MRFSDDELKVIQATFQNNDDLLKLLRKVFLPEIDPTAPIGQVIDLWFTLQIPDQLPAEQAMVLIKARNTLIGHVEFQLQQLSTLANQATKTAEEVAAAQAQDSAQ